MANDGPQGVIDRRGMIGGSVALAASALGARAAAARRSRKFPDGFLWGAATAGHQVEGNDVNSDYWLLENVKPTIFADRAGDACDSYHRFEEDASLAAELGFNCQRLSIEWSRIEPEPGAFSIAALDYYARVLEACRRRGLAPIVTFNHFTTPRWFAARGGFEASDAPQLFARFADRSAERLSGLMHAAATFNEPNLIISAFWRKRLADEIPGIAPMVAAAARASGSDRFVSYLLGDMARVQPNLMEAHRQAYQAIKARRPSLPVGVCLSMQDDQGPAAIVRQKQLEVYDPWLEVASKSDFVGVQVYSRGIVGEAGDLPPPKGADLTQVGYEFYPRALGPAIRYAAARTGKPVYVTENGVATEDDKRRTAYIDGALGELCLCLEDGIDVRSYIHWSLLDNFEWIYGYRPKFGLVAVDRQTFRRTPKPSAYHLGGIARANAF